MRTERARLDPKARKRLSQLDDTDPLFLTRRRTAYNRDAFYHNWRKLSVARPPQRVEEVELPSLEYTPHDIRHLRVTVWLTNIRKVESASEAEMLRRCVQGRMAWRSPLTILCYDHSFSEREEEEAFAAFQQQTERQAEISGAGASLMVKVQPQGQPSEPQQSAAMLQALADLAFWKDES